MGAVLCAALLCLMATPSLARRRPEASRPRYILRAGQLGRAHFGEQRRAVVRKLNRLLRHGPSEYYHAVRSCGVDHAVGWPGLAAFFYHGRFVGYTYRPANGDRQIPILATPLGLRVGDTLSRARQLYGRSFHSSAHDGGRWWATTPQGRVQGVASGWPGGPRGSVATIGAGQLGCLAP